MVTRLLPEGLSCAFACEVWAPSAAEPARLAIPMPPNFRKLRREFVASGFVSCPVVTVSCLSCFIFIVLSDSEFSLFAQFSGNLVSNGRNLTPGSGIRILLMGGERNEAAKQIGPACLGGINVLFREMPQGREDGATSFAVIRPGCESNYRTPAHLRILFIFLPAARLRRLLQTMEGQDLEVVLLTSRLISLPEPGHRSSTTSTPNNSATASHPRAHQPPFPRPPGRPNGCFRSLPLKAIS